MSQTIEIRVRVDHVAPDDARPSDGDQEASSDHPQDAEDCLPDEAGYGHGV